MVENYIAWEQASRRADDAQQEVVELKRTGLVPTRQFLENLERLEHEATIKLEALRARGLTSHVALGL